MKNMYSVLCLLFCIGMSGCLQAVDLSENSFDETLPILFRGDLSPANAAYSITRSGVYQLTSAKTASGVPNISITANNVTLDLGGNTLTGGTNGIEVTGNNVTVKNGTISGMTQSGLLVQGSGFHVENCDVVASVIGISLQSSSECVIENCRVRNMTQTGVSLQSTWTSSVRGCEISGIHGVGSVYGVLAQNGGNNTVEQCVIRDLQTNSLTVGDEVGGIVLDNEIASQAHDNQIGAVVSLTTTAQVYGILTRATFNGTAKLPGQPTIAGVNPQVEIDSSGNALAVWQQGSPSQIYYSRSTTGLDWSLASTIPGQPSSAGENPQLAFDGSDNAFAVWSQGSPAQIYYSRFTVGLDWSLATTVPGQNPLNAGANPSIACNDSGVAVAVWTQGGKIYAAYYTSGWSNAASISGSETSPFISNVAIDQSGNALAFWNATDAEFINQLYYARYMAGSGTWSASAKMPGQPAQSAGYYPSVAFDSSGNAIAVWYQNNGSNLQIYYAHYTAGSGTWSNAATIPGQPANTGFIPQVAFDSSDNALVVWFQSDGIRTQIYYARYTAVTSMWSNAAKIPGQILQNAYDPKVAVDSAGNAVVVWYQSNPAQIYFARYIAESSLWIGAEKILGQPSNDGFYPQVAVDTAGNATAVWQQSDGTRNQIYASYYSSGSGLIKGNGISGVTGYDAQGIGIMAPNRYVASNLCYDCDISFSGVPTQFIDSQANARGVDNIDTNLTTPDTVTVIQHDQLPMIESQLDGLYAPLFTIESMLDILTQCESISVTAAGTLSTDYGIYCLGSNITGQLSITGTGIDFDLSGHVIDANSGANGLVISGNDVSVHNGTVRNASASGVKVIGNNCLFDKLVSYGNLTGFELSNADNNIVTNCSAINNTREGYLLATSDYNSFSHCRAVNTSGSSAVAGIKTTGGTSNRFDACDINGVASSAGEAYGLLASNEQKSSIVSCAVNGVSGANYTAGVALIGDYLGTPTAQDFVGLNESRVGRNVDWLNTPVGSYVAVANDSGGAKSAQVYSFSPIAGLTSVVASGALASFVYRVKWLTWQNSYYLAIEGDGGATAGNPEIIVFKFDPAASTLTAAGSFDYTGVSKYALGEDWVISGTVPYLLYTGVTNTTAGANELGVLRYNGSTLTFVNGVDFPGSDYAWSVNAHLVNGKWKLAVTSNNGTKPLVEIYTFDDPQGSASLVLSTTSFDVATAQVVLNTSWLDFDGQTYLAFGTTNHISGPVVYVLKYTDSPEDLSVFATYDYAATIVHGVDWLVTGTTVYLAVSGDLANNRTTLLRFDPYQASTTTRLSNYYVCSAENQNGYGLRWNRVAGNENRAYLGVGKLGSVSTPYLRVFGFDLNGQSQLNVISDNLVSDVAGGSGLLVDTVVNGVTGNRAYNCQDGLVEGVQTTYPGPQFDDSNWNVPHA